MKESIIITVSQDGMGDYETIKNAIKAAMEYQGENITIKISKGIYKERLTINQPKLTLQGEDNINTIITYDDYANYIMADGEKRGTFRTPTIFIDTNDFVARNITFENSAGSGAEVGQALALYVDGDRITFENCRILGGQDTIFTAPLPPFAYEQNGFRGTKEFSPRIHGKHYYRNCFICGDVDFIFGGATAYFEACELYSNNMQADRKGYVTAASTSEETVYGYVFNYCKFTGDCPADSVYLGRPWRNFAKVVILNSYMGEHIKKEGWDDWGKIDAHDTVFFAEYNNTGKGAKLENRPSWIKILTQQEAENFCKEKVLELK